MSEYPSRVVSLVNRFDRNRYAYRSPVYNQVPSRREFIDPFFKQLGWHVWNEGGLGAALVHE